MHCTAPFTAHLPPHGLAADASRCTAPLPLLPLQVMHQASALRAHIYSLSRKVLLGSGAIEGLPLDLFLGGVGIEMGHILRDEQAAGKGLYACWERCAGVVRVVPVMAGAREVGAHCAGMGAIGACLAWRLPPSTMQCALNQSLHTLFAFWLAAGLPQHVLDFFGNGLPHSRLALLVFAEFVPVDPLPIAAALQLPAMVA
jgi:hypothetical protein